MGISKLFGGAEPKKILFVASEAAPFMRIGGLGSVMYSLPRALRAIGHDARVFLPRYLSVDTHAHRLKTECEHIEVPTGNETEPTYLVCNIKKYDGSEQRKNSIESSVPAYFLENQEYYEQRANVYGYADDHVRWALLTRGVLEFIRVARSWVPDIIVASDWMAGLLPNYLKTVYKDNATLSQIATVFSIHNLFFQGMFDHRFVQEMDYDDGHSPIPGFHHERMAKINFMRRGIMYANVVNTVSPTYAKEVMTKEFGEDLDYLLRERRAVLTGILNGIDYQNWDPAHDSAVANPFTANRIQNRALNKGVLQDRFGLPQSNEAFLVSIVSRLDNQKGLDLFSSVAETLLRELPMQLIVVGEGDTSYLSFFRDLETKFPDQVATHLKFDDVLPHEVFAGTDVVLIPSRFEPSGLVQMEAMRYGAIPIVRKTGGLADTVENFDPGANIGTGFVFERLDSHSLLVSVVRAFETFRHKEAWRALQRRAMTQDFSWERSAREYEKIFLQAVELHSRSRQSSANHEVA